MNIKEAYELGFDNGYGIADSNMSDFDTIVRNAFEQQENDQDTFVSECLLTEMDHFRQFSPFEFYAKEMNESPDPDTWWDAYNEGVYDGIYCVVYEKGDIEKYRQKASKITSQLLSNYKFRYF